MPITSTHPPSHSHSHQDPPSTPPELLRPPRRAGRPRAHRLPAGETPTHWGVAVGRGGGNGGVFPGRARLPRYRRRTPSNETLFGEPGRFYVYVSYGIHHCVNVEAEGRHSTSEAAPLATLPR